MKKSRIRDNLILAVTAFITITVCSKCSFLYAFNDWMDANCFLTVGKSMLHGLVPYRDLFEQKGPLLYMLHALAALISDTSFIGVYLLEIAACFFFLFFSLRTMKLVWEFSGEYTLSRTHKIIPPYENISQKKSITVFGLIPVLAAIVYSASAFCQGDSAEEFCLPLLAYAVYIALRSIINTRVPNRWECITIGITSACVLWMKFSILGLYLGWFFLFVSYLIKNHHFQKIFSMILWISVGILFVSLPVLLYFAANHALGDLWEVYFYDNLLVYSHKSDSSSFFLLNYLTGIVALVVYNTLPFFAIVIGTILLKKKKAASIYSPLIAMMISAFLLIFIGDRCYPYYPLIFSVFTPIGLCAIAQFIQESVLSLFSSTHYSSEYQPMHSSSDCQLVHSSSKQRTVHTFSRYLPFYINVICIVWLYLFSGNTSDLQYQKSDYPQYQFAEIIAQTENATLLNYGFLDGGFYTATGIIPSCRYFFKPNMDLSEIMDAQNEYVANGETDYVITCNRKLDSDLYECVSTASCHYEIYDLTYYLYQRIS